MALRAESRAHVVLEKWMVSELGLKGDKLVIYAIIYGCSLAGNQEYTASISYFCEWLDLTRTQVLSVLRELEQDKLIIRRSKDVDGVIYNSYRAVIPVMDDDRLGGGKSIKDIMPEPENTQSEDDEKIPYSDIIGYLNVRAGFGFKDNSENTRKHIRARWREGYRIEDFRTVIEGRVQAWKSDPKMRDYLRPQTLFNSKFESYLQTAKRQGITPIATDGGNTEGEDVPVTDDNGNPVEY